jgi:hypothetical protein
VTARELILTVLLFATVLPAAGRAQILRELPGVTLEYVILDRATSEPIGKASVSFEPVDTKRGPRLEVRARTEYTVTHGRGDDPFPYDEEVSLICDTTGVTRFDATVHALGKEQIHTAVRIGEDYHVSTTFDGERNSRTITAGVQRTNLGVFCGGYLETPLDQGPLLADWPLLFPAAADHGGRQKFRESTGPIDVGGREVRAITTRIKRGDESSYRIWNSANELQILLRMEDNVPQADLLYILANVNGVPAVESELLD